MITYKKATNEFVLNGTHDITYDMAKEIWNGSPQDVSFEAYRKLARDPFSRIEFIDDGTNYISIGKTQTVESVAIKSHQYMVRCLNWSSPCAIQIIDQIMKVCEKESPNVLGLCIMKTCVHPNVDSYSGIFSDWMHIVSETASYVLKDIKVYHTHHK